jgi:hypothetical protein
LIISAHQSHFLPWLGYFNKVAKSDVFVWLENVQFRKNYFQNRTKIKVSDNEFWLTVTVKKASLETYINEIEIIKAKDYKKIAKTLVANYSKAPYFKEYFPSIERILGSDIANLNELNFQLFEYFIDVLKIGTKVIRSSELELQEEDPNLRLIEICNKLNATNYIAGKGSSNYMNQELFKKENINILWQNYPVADINYNQLGKEFLPGLSALDSLFNIGAEETRELIFVEWKS